MPRLQSNLISVYVVRRAPPGAATPIELLMLQRPVDYAVPGDWQAVHGHIEPGEVAWRAALREQQEETGLPVLNWYRLAEIESFFNPVNDVIYLVPAFVAVVPRDADNCDIRRTSIQRLAHTRSSDHYVLVANPAPHRRNASRSNPPIGPPSAWPSCRWISKPLAPSLASEPLPPVATEPPPVSTE